MSLALLLLIACGGYTGCGSAPAPPAPLSEAEQATAAKAAMLRVRLHARFMELSDKGVRVRIDNPTEVAVQRAQIVLEGRSATGDWQRSVWTGPLAPWQQDAELWIEVPQQLIGGIRVTMTQAIPEPVSEH